VSFRQHQPVVPGMLYQSPTRFHQPLLHAGQRPVFDLARQSQPPLLGLRAPLVNVPPKVCYQADTQADSSYTGCLE